MHQLAVKTTCILFLLLQMVQPFAATLQPGATLVLAQLGVDTIDLDPPEVDHIPESIGIAGTPQTISVRASDEQGVASVTLLYRYNQATEYKRVLMRQVNGSDNYTITLEPGANQSRMEYYFLVIDIGGNKVLNGFPYNPFSRTFTTQLTTETLPQDDKAVPESQRLPLQTTTQVNDQTNTGSLPKQNEEKRTNTVIWAILGALVIGALAASGGGDEPPTATDTVPVVFDIPLP